MKLQPLIVALLAARAAGGVTTEWVLQVGGDADKEKMIAKRAQQTGFLKAIYSKLLIGWPLRRLCRRQLGRSSEAAGRSA